VYYIRWAEDHKPFILDEDGKKQYTGEDYYEICIGRFNDCVDKYLVIYEMLNKRMSMERFTSSLQREY